MWNVAGGLGVYGILVRFLLLTGQRLDKVQTMMWSDLLDDQKVWKIRTESAREKSHGGTLRLPPLVRAVLAPLQPVAGNPYVFVGRKGHFSGISQAKARLDKASGVTGWTLHDLRRTARTLMPRAGVSADNAERLLGHVPPGIRGNYDWHCYTAEKADALQKLADLIHDIVQPGSELAARQV